ncbi:MULTISPECIES: TetR/AcrR family transcriptional regulator [Actinopolyspora]|uniref:DNA-binding transcriptional regulator, AcrR family n=1 Tax=Actinopolyspora saharensis TaxID=995062 RepID=A0A1H1FY31_9ACTN|nr:MULTISPECIES: TetR/AcrR family transcriptional regulator [Actinopolyspora]NHD16237.1 TetR/AcrR family transcriptional regulator [Actinopolyspora sp. BKK2]NHE75900.1 TetR/AcrR family transcriptional regulator [Actinopolyspora sp. BKK1]SDR05894.1 DNA-binding transcriptional regulator, AcrR family [Actinopolyspora saharensis]
MTTAQQATDYDERVIDAAREVFAQQGFAAPISEVAELAGVGVASIYRRYPNKRELAERVRIAATRRIVAEAESAREAESDPWKAFERFMYGCLREHTGIGVVLPPHADCGGFSEELLTSRERMISRVEELVAAAQRAGELRGDLRAADVFVLFKHLNPPLSTDEPRRAELRARYLTLVLPGLRDGSIPLPGAAPDWDELRRMCETGADSTHSEG